MAEFTLSNGQQHDGVVACRILFDFRGRAFTLANVVAYAGELSGGLISLSRQSRAA